MLLLTTNRVSYKECAVERANRTETGRTRRIYGVATFHENPRVFEFTFKNPKSVQDLYRVIEEAASIIKFRYPALKLCPTPSGWMKLQGDRIRIDLLFAETGCDPEDRSSAFSRRNSLDFHLQAESESCGTLKKCKVVRGESPIKDHDGSWYIRKSSLSYLPKTTIIKMIGFADYSKSHLLNPSPVIKGMVKVLNEYEWHKLCKSCGVAHDFDAIIPEVTIKFDNHKDVIENLKVFKVFNNRLSRKSSFSIQAAERMPLTEHGQELCAKMFSSAVREVMSAYQDPTGKEISKLINSVVEDSFLLREESNSDVIETLESLSAINNALLTGLPMNDSEFVNSSIDVLLTNRTKSVRVDGFTTVTMPNNKLNKHEIIIPQSELNRLHLSIGEILTVGRYPNTGIEMAEFKIVGTTNDRCVYLNPTFWAERFAGDFDGDLCVVHDFNGVIDESKIQNSISPKQKGKGDMLVVESVARAFYCKYLIPFADSILSICAEHGKSLEPGRVVLQNIIDSIKHFNYIPDQETIMHSSFLTKDDTASPISYLLRGKLGSDKKLYSLKYNITVGKFKDHHSNIAWMREVEKEFKFLIHPNRKYVDLILDKSNKNIVKDYEALLKDIKLSSLIGIKPNKEPVPSLPKEITAKSYAGALKETKRIISEFPSVAHLSKEVINLYNSWINELRFGNVERAFNFMNQIHKIIKLDERLGEMILRYLFIAITYQTDNAIIIKSMKIFSYLPILLGKYNLFEYIKKLGYVRNFNLQVKYSSEKKLIAFKSNSITEESLSSMISQLRNQVSDFVVVTSKQMVADICTSLSQEHLLIAPEEAKTFKVDILYNL